ncbi:MAG: lactate utilization protein [Clostridiales bacterium]|nr:lactate utilization protein [Clostridiales bacterium]
MDYMKETYPKLAASVIRKLEARNMDGVYFAAAEEAKRAILAEMPDGSSVTWGGSMTCEQMGLFEACLSSSRLQALDRTAAKTPEERRELYARQTLCDYFLMSANAVTMDGELVNIDGNGNRVACLITGPAHVFVICGMNKIVTDLDSAVKRARNTAAPANVLRVGRTETPCLKNGRCADCLSPESICNQFVITRRSGVKGRIKVFLIGEALGY